MEQKLSYRVFVRLFQGENKCFGPEVYTLLKQVEAFGALRKAAATMNMAYSKAWAIYKRAEEGLGIALLSTDIGGSGGGGAKLTTQALDYLSRYEGFISELDTCAQAAYTKWFETDNPQ